MPAVLVTCFMSHPEMSSLKLFMAGASVMEAPVQKDESEWAAKIQLMSVTLETFLFVAYV